MFDLLNVLCEVMSQIWKGGKKSTITRCSEDGRFGYDVLL